MHLNKKYLTNLQATTMLTHFVQSVRKVNKKNDKGLFNMRHHSN